MATQKQKNRRLRYDQMKADGICTNCREKLARPNRTRCEDCADKQRQYKRKHNLKKPRTPRKPRVEPVEIVVPEITLTPDQRISQLYRDCRVCFDRVPTRRYYDWADSGD